MAIPALPLWADLPHTYDNRGSVSDHWFIELCSAVKASGASQRFQGGESCLNARVCASSNSFWCNSGTCSTLEQPCPLFVSLCPESCAKAADAEVQTPPAPPRHSKQQAATNAKRPRESQTDRYHEQDHVNYSLHVREVSYYRDHNNTYRADLVGPRYTRFLRHCCHISSSCICNLPSSRAWISTILSWICTKRTCDNM